MAAAARQPLPVEPTLCLKHLQDMLFARQNWLLGAQQVTDAVARLAEAAVQFECSRRGKLWAPGAQTVCALRCKLLLVYVELLH